MHRESGDIVKPEWTNGLPAAYKRDNKTGKFEDVLVYKTADYVVVYRGGKIFFDVMVTVPQANRVGHCENSGAAAAKGEQYKLGHRGPGK